MAKIAITKVWNLLYDLAIHIVAPNGKLIIIDLGAKSNLSPVISLWDKTYTQVLDVCVSIAARPVKTEGDNLVIDSLLREVFEKIDRRVSGLVLKKLFLMTADSNLRTRAIKVFGLVHPLV